MIPKLSLFLSLFFLFTIKAKSAELKIFTWEDYFSESVIEKFEAKYSHKVSLIYFDSEMRRNSVVYSGKAAKYDLIVMDSLTVGEMGKAGILAELSQTINQSESLFTERSKAACTKYGIPYSNGTMGVGYRTSVTKKTFSSWMDVFTYALENPQTVVLPEDDYDTVAIALLALGYEPMSESENELKHAYQLLSDVIDKLLELRTSTAYALDKREKSEMEVAVMYSGETELISDVTDQDDWTYTVPYEGTLLWDECLTTHIDRPITKAAREFVNFINETGNAIENAEEVWFTSSNKKVLDSARDVYLQDSELFPGNLLETNLYQYTPLTKDAERLRSQILSVIQNRNKLIK